MTYPMQLPDPLVLAWVVEVRRGPSVWHIHPDSIDRYVAEAESVGEVQRRCPCGVIHLGESELASIRSFAARSPR